jgi:transcriptional regulator with XRE-family HTH domain
VAYICYRARMVDFAARINYFREAQGVSIAAIADSAGLSRQYVNELASGAKTRPTLEVAEKLAECFGVTLAEFLGVQPKKGRK